MGSLGILLVFGIWNATSEHWEPPKSDKINTTEVDAILAHAKAYEGFTVAFVSWLQTIEKQSNNTIFTFYGLNGVLSALVTSPIGSYMPGDNLAIKGVAYLVSRGYILVDAIQKINIDFVIGFSIVAGVLLIYYFFGAFTFDSGLSFKRRE